MRLSNSKWSEHPVNPGPCNLSRAALRFRCHNWKTGRTMRSLLHASLSRSYRATSDRSWIGSAKFTAKSDVDFTARLVVVHDIKVVESCFQDDLEPPAKVLELERQLLPAVRRIEQQLSSVAPANYTTWADARYAKLGILRDISKAHIQALQQLASTCPGGLLGTASQS